MRYFFLFFITILSFAQQTTKVDFIKCNAFLLPQKDTKSITGIVVYDFKVNAAIDTIRIDAKNITFSDVKINGKEVKYKNNNKELALYEGFKSGKNSVTFSYAATPKQTLYFIGEADNLQIWTQGQGKYTSHWLPSFDDVNEKVIFNLSIGLEKEYQVISNGVQIPLKKPKKYILPPIWDVNKNWSFQMKKPMSSYLLMLAIGKFINQKQIASSGIPLEFYLDQKDEDKFEPTYRYSKQIFDFFEKEIGVKYPWGIYRQVPVRDFLYAGMENTTSTIFAQDYVVNEIGFNDRNYVNVNAHELAHQWFGDMITAKSGKHHWLQEGFATYYALLAEKEVFGEDYFYYQLYKNAIQLQNAVKNDTIPILNDKASSLSFYQKGAWALHSIREAIGEEKFKKVIKAYLKKYQFKNVETEDFLAEIRKVTDFNTEKFKKTWLEDYHFQADEVNKLLKKNQFIQQLQDVQSYKNKSFSEKEIYFTELMNSDAFYPIKVEIIYQIVKVPFEEKKHLLAIAMKTNSIEVRRAIANSISKVPAEFKIEYESLLNDNSYYTKEIAFGNLWESFPNEQKNYIEKAKNWEGNNDKSLRILYLSYSQLSNSINIDDKAILYKELQDYTSSNFESSIRQNAIDAILTINSKDEIMLKNLINATIHFKWQFSKYAKDKIKELVKSDEIRFLFEKMLLELNTIEKNQLSKLL